MKNFTAKITLVALVSAVIFSSCTGTRYGRLPKVKSDKQAKIERKKRETVKKDDAVAIVQPEATLITPPETATEAHPATAVTSAIAKQEINKTTQTSKRRDIKKLAKLLENDPGKQELFAPQSVQKSSSLNQQEKAAGESSMLKTIGWVLIIIGGLILLFASILLGLLVMLGGLLFIVVG